MRNDFLSVMILVLIIFQETLNILLLYSVFVEIMNTLICNRILLMNTK
jgi:hypothetical protein